LIVERYAIYRLLHLGGMFAMFMALGGIALHVVNGGTKQSNTGRRLIAALHGTALFIILLGGFGMLARLKIVQGGLPPWIYAKLAIWAVMAAMGTLMYRQPVLARWMLVALPLLGMLASWVAVTKPM
jgi:hypothetical protein